MARYVSLNSLYILQWHPEYFVKLLCKFLHEKHIQATKDTLQLTSHPRPVQSESYTKLLITSSIALLYHNI